MDFLWLVRFVVSQTDRKLNRLNPDNAVDVLLNSVFPVSCHSPWMIAIYNDFNLWEPLNYFECFTSASE